MPRPLRILHTSDLHGALSPDREDRLRTLRADADLWLDAGDVIGRPRASLADDPTLRRIADAGCDGVVPGNHEYLVLTGAGEPPLPFVAANLMRHGKPMFPPFLTFEIAGWRVAVIGVATPFLKYSARPLKRLGGGFAAFAHELRVENPFEAARSWTARLRSESDLVLLLSHLGAEGDAKLARAAPDADVILGGHSHELTPPTFAEGIWTARAGRGGTHVGKYAWNGAQLTGDLLPL